MSQIRIQVTGPAEITAASDGGVTISVPIRLRLGLDVTIVSKAGEEHEVGGPAEPPTTLQTALVRGYRWLGMLETGTVHSLREIAAREGVDRSYVSRMVMLTTLAPEMVRAILDDALPEEVGLFDLAVNPPVLWHRQAIPMTE